MAEQDGRQSADAEKRRRFGTARQSAALRRFFVLESLASRLLITCTVAPVLTLSLVTLLVVSVFDLYPGATLGWHTQYREAQRLVAAVATDKRGQPTLTRIRDTTCMWFAAFPKEVRLRIVDDKGQAIPVANLLQACNPESHVAPERKDIGARDRGANVDPTAIPFPGNNQPFRAADGRQKWMEQGKRFYIVTDGFDLQGRKYFLQLAMSERAIAIYVHSRLQPVDDVIFIAAVISVIIFAVAMWDTLRRTLRPVREVSAAAAAISPGNLAARLCLAGVPSELHAMVNAFNGALDRLEAGFKKQQMFLASTAHELQTPLTLIRGQIEVSDEVIDRTQLLQDVDHMSRQVRQLLHLAEVGEPQSYRFRPVPIDRVLSDVTQFLERQASKAHVQLLLKSVGAVVLPHVDESAAFVLFKNLIENAIVASAPFSVVVIEIGLDTVSVADEGAGIDSDHLPSLFTPFWRGPDSHYAGAGLGLSICAEIASAHGWDLAVDASLHGTCFVVSFRSVSREGLA